MTRRLRRRQHLRRETLILRRQIQAMAEPTGIRGPIMEGRLVARQSAYRVSADAKLQPCLSRAARARG